MPRRDTPRARHRLGSPGLVHCVAYPAVAAALVARQCGWWHALLVPARHSLAGPRRRTAVGWTAARA
ncbi:hypothetical protein [Longimycelium tulufanense]|uniref:hypothetical protein n=1 Tax=Longimycelium tulufanense TaxID=907463 RepID=UPI0016691FA1|nr:hypothetical protein [Longimycelium tulufanense]